MRVGITAEFIGVKSCGPATYTRNLLVGLAGLTTAHQFYPYLATRAAFEQMPRVSHITPRMVGPYNAWLRVPVTLPLELLRQRVDLLHAQGWAPPWCPCPVVLTVHDLSWETTPQTYTRAMRWRLTLLVRTSVRRAVRIITSSRHSAQDLMRLYHVAHEKIRVIYPALDPTLTRVTDVDALARTQRRYGISGPYLLYLGVIEPKKNIDRLIRAYATLRERQAAPRLVIAGRLGWLAQPIVELGRALARNGDILFTGKVAQEDIAALYSGADAFAFLSSSEGFGYPPLEAMACGTPTVVSNLTSLPEVVGDAALLVNPLDTEAIAQALSCLLNDVALRRHLQTAGYERSRQFQPERLASQVVAVYEECDAEARSLPSTGKHYAGLAKEASLRREETTNV